VAIFGGVTLDPTSPTAPFKAASPELRNKMVNISAIILLANIMSDPR
jgi:hypothetical protein